MTRSLPIFALPGVVLLPETLLPLHIFEARYRAMVSDALGGDRTIGMSLMKPGWENGGADPDVFPIGGAGEIVDAERLEDGRYNIVLQGRFRFRIVAEVSREPYRRARVEIVDSTPFATSEAKKRAESGLARLYGGVQSTLELPPLPDEPLGAERLASEIALRLRFAPRDLQELLETDSLPARFDRLRGRLEEWIARMKALAPFRPEELDPARN